MKMECVLEDRLDGEGAGRSSSEDLGALGANLSCVFNVSLSSHPKILKSIRVS